MTNKSLLIVFLKNMELGKVKTRIAQTLGNENALFVYEELVEITKEAINKLLNCDIQLCFSSTIPTNQEINYLKSVQQGADLGERMKNAFLQGFEKEYDKICLIGSDLPSISAEIIQQGFDSLNNNDIVFGPSEDGGYYLVGINKMIHTIFENKPWSTKKLLQVTLNELQQKKIFLLETLNDIDDYEDLKKYPSLLKLVEKNQFNNLKINI